MSESKTCPHCNVSFTEEDWPDGTACPVCGKGGAEEPKGGGLDGFFLGVSRLFSGIVNVLFLLIKLGIVALVCYALFMLYHYAMDKKQEPVKEETRTQGLLGPALERPRVLEAQGLSFPV